ncbi:MAG: FHA domain-containing protein [Fimbriimonadaceae bacterium]
MDANRTQILNSDPNRTIMGAAPTLNATVTIKPIQCPVCKTFNPAGLMFCKECGLIFDRALPDDAFGAPTVLLPMLVDSNGREHPIRPGESLIGREADIMLNDTQVSRRHARLVSSDGGFTLEDLGSTNGTRVNGNPLTVGQVQPINPGDTLSFGSFECKLHLPGGGLGATQAFSSNKTAAIAAAPTIETAVAKLVGADQTWPLQSGANTFGRRAENDVVIADAYVSGKHGVIEITEDAAFLTDIGSTNGTMLNDAKLAPNMRTAMRADDVIRLGSIELRIER